MVYTLNGLYLCCKEREMCSVLLVASQILRILLFINISIMNNIWMSAKIISTELIFDTMKFSLVKTIFQKLWSPWTLTGQEKRYSKSGSTSCVTKICCAWARPRLWLHSKNANLSMVFLWTLAVIVSGPTASHNSGSLYAENFSFGFQLGTSGVNKACFLVGIASSVFICTRRIIDWWTFIAIQSISSGDQTCEYNKYVAEL